MRIDGRYMFFAVKGNAGAGGGAIVTFSGKTRIYESELGSAHWIKREENMKKVNTDYPPALDAARSLDELMALAIRHMQELFAPHSFLLLIPPLRKSLAMPEIDQMIEVALEENKPIYLPDLRLGQAVTMGQLPDEMHHLYHEPVTAVGGSPEALSGILQRTKTDSFSLVVVPLTCGFDEPGLSLEEYPRYGVLVLTAGRTDLLHGLAGLVPLRIYAEKLAIAISFLSGSSTY